jgi:hypothetical protein
MSILGLAILIVYTAALALIFGYCLVQLHLALQYVRGHRRAAAHPEPVPALPGEAPRVTVQLPLYNER